MPWGVCWVQQVQVRVLPQRPLPRATKLTGCLLPACLAAAGDEDERHLAELGPGSMIEVSKVAGAG